MNKTVLDDDDRLASLYRAESAACGVGSMMAADLTILVVYGVLLAAMLWV